MGLKASVNKFFAPIFWGNLLAMALLVVALGVGVIYWLDYYTLHGQTARVPNVVKQQEQTALEALEAVGLQGEVRDTGYVAGLPAGVILDQSEDAGKEVKPGRIIYLTINSGHARLVSFPDIADNSSLREAQVRLQAMGFSIAPIRYTHGERDWVYEVRVNGKSVRAGERVPSNAVVTLFVGTGMDDLNDSLLDAYNEEVPLLPENAPADEDKPVPLEAPARTTTTVAPKPSSTAPTPKATAPQKPKTANGYEF